MTTRPADVKNSTAESEERYLDSVYGLRSELPTVEYPDGFRIQVASRDLSFYISEGAKLVPRNTPRASGKQGG